MMRSITASRVVLVSLVLLAASCSNGVAAPEVGALEETCNADFCVGYPAGWDVVEVGGQFISFAHPGSEDVVATVGRVNMEGVVVNAGGLWPQRARDVVDHLWTLLDGGDAELQSVDPGGEGSFDSWGNVSSGRLWHRLVPVTTTVGIGIEVRGPNVTWEAHADAFRQNVSVLNTEL